MYFQVPLGESVPVNLSNVTKIVVTLVSDDTDEEVEVKLSTVGCIEDVPGTLIIFHANTPMKWKSSCLL